jgi:hypothetical protein
VAALPPGKRCWDIVRETDGSDLTVAARVLAESLQPDRSATRGVASDLASAGRRPRLDRAGGGRAAIKRGCGEGSRAPQA